VSLLLVSLVDLAHLDATLKENANQVLEQPVAFSGVNVVQVEVVVPLALWDRGARAHREVELLNLPAMTK